MPKGVDTTRKFLKFRPYYGNRASLFKGPPLPNDIGQYYKINNAVDLRLVRFTLEDNGVIEDRAYN